MSNLRTIEMVDAGNIRVKVDFFAPEGASDEDVEQAAHWNYNLVHGEDKPVCEAVQKNITAGSFDEGPMMMESEDIMQAFQKRHLRHLNELPL